MTVKTVLAAAALALTPMLATAQCFGEAHEQQAMTCAEGHVFDAESNSCVVIAS